MEQINKSRNTTQMTKREEIIKVAEGELHYKEEPAGSNHTKFGEWFNLDRLPWCAMFVSWVFWKANKPLPRIDTYKGFSSCPNGLKYWKENDCITVDPAPGDIVLYDWNSDSKADHTGIFKEWVERGKTFLAIEGNTSPTNASNGGEVLIMKRKVSQVAAFVNPLNIEFP
jgi:hypothetical protein